MDSSLDTFRVNSDLCRRDGICARICPVGIIRGEAGTLPFMDAERRNRCIACGQCMAFCPARACAAPGLRLEDCRELRKDLYPAPEQVDELLFARRTIRNFRETPVPRETFARILDVVRFAPTGENNQPIRWIITQDLAASRALLERVIEWMRRLPDVDPEAASISRAAGIARAWDRGVDVISRRAPHIVIPVGPDKKWESLDAVVNLSYFEITAHAHGVGCCWSGQLTRAFRHPAGGAVREYLGLNPGERAYSAVVAGLAQFRAVSRPPRNPSRITWK